MNTDLRRRFVRDLVADISQVGGARFEDFATYLDGLISGTPGLRRGTNLEGTPVSGSVDSVSPAGDRVVETSSDKDYFRPKYSKVWHDLRHAIAEHPGSVISLHSSRECGPKASAYLTRLVRRLKTRNLALEWYDSRRLAEYIVDERLTSISVIERLKPFLANLERISEQYAVSDLLPQLDAQFLGREIEIAQIDSLMSEQSVVAICGIGGQGKTELACALSHRIHGRFEQVIWIQADDVTTIEQLNAYDIRRTGYRQNLVALLKSSSVLLILDNLLVDLDMQRLADCCGERSRIVVTSQTSMSSHVYPLSALGEGLDAKILNAGLSVECPSEVLSRIRHTIGGHPLVLRIINAMVRVDEHSWSDVAADCDAVGEFEDDRRQRVADRILLRHVQTLGKELSFIAWCESNLIDRQLLVACLSPVGLTKLERRAFVTRSQSDVVRVHDVVYRSITSIQAALPPHYDFSLNVAQYVSRICLPKGLPLFRVTHRHPTLIVKSLVSRPSSAALQYAYTVAQEADQLDLALLSDPTLIFERLLASEAVDTVALESLLAIIESLYRRTRKLHSPAAAKTELRDRMVIYDCLIESAPLTEEQRTVVRHHRGKSYLKLGDEAKAKIEFETVLQSAHPLAATKLQMARLCQDDPERGKELIAEILRTSHDNPMAVSESVVLESVHTLGRQHLKRFFEEMTLRFGEFFVSRIKAAAFTGFDQPYEALTTAAIHWSFRAPELLINIMEDLPIPPVSTLRGTPSLLHFAELLKLTGKALAEVGRIEEASDKWKQATDYYLGVFPIDAYSARGAAENEILRKRFVEAAEILEKVPAMQRDKFWHQRKAQCSRGLGLFADALLEINIAIDSLTGNSFAAAFYELRSQIRHDLNDLDFIDDMRRAIEVADSPLYKRRLQERLASFLSPPPAA